MGKDQSHVLFAAEAVKAVDKEKLLCCFVPSRISRAWGKERSAFIMFHTSDR